MDGLEVFSASMHTVNSHSRLLAPAVKVAYEATGVQTAFNQIMRPEEPVSCEK